MTTKQTLATIAATAGVSTATVSRVLNNKPGVKESTRDAVMRAAKEAGVGAPSSSIVAILVPELSNPSFAQFAQELTQILYAAGYSAFVCTSVLGSASEVAYLDVLLESDISGIISVSGTSADALSSKVPYERLMAEGLPSVHINGDASSIDAPFFRTSNEEAIEIAVRHLRELGHERIGLATGQRRYSPTVAKIKSFLALGFTEEDIATTDYTGDGGARAGRRLLESGHTGIICASDVMALGLIREAARDGLRPPRDYSVIGYDDAPIMHLTELTTIRQPISAISEAAVATLLRMLRGEEVDYTEQVFSPDLSVRGTTGAP